MSAFHIELRAIPFARCGAGAAHRALCFESVPTETSPWRFGAGEPFGGDPWDDRGGRVIVTIMILAFIGIACAIVAAAVVAGAS